MTTRNTLDSSSERTPSHTIHSEPARKRRSDPLWVHRVMMSMVGTGGCLAVTLALFFFCSQRRSWGIGEESQYDQIADFIGANPLLILVLNVLVGTLLGFALLRLFVRRPSPAS